MVSNIQISQNSLFKRIIIRLLNVFGWILYVVTGGWLNKHDSIGEVKRILIIELWGIGDLVMMSTILKPLKEKYPDAEITLLSKDVANNLFLNNMYIDHFVNYTFPWTKFFGKYNLWQWRWKEMAAVIKSLRDARFDLILDARGDIRNNFITYFIGGKIRVGYNWLGGGYFLTDVVKLSSRNIHRIEAWKNFLRYFQIEDKLAVPNIHLLEEEEQWAQNYLNEKGIMKGDFVVGVHPGAHNRARRWPLEQFASVASYVRDNFDAKIVVFVSPDGFGDDIPMQGDYIKVKLTLRKMIAVLDKMNLFICNDGGAMHLATAVHTPVISIFGPGNPDWFSPYGDKNSVVIRENIHCRPCFDYCRYRDPFCIVTITAGEVLDAIDDKMKDICSKTYA